ncbi:MAG: Dyp-type peroxidase, partial [Burkholderiaceae bacterium]
MSVKQSDTQLQGITDLCLIATVKPGFVSAFETITHVERLRRVLKTLNSLRQAAREISDPPDPSLAFTDVVSRFRIVHSFRWAIIDPKPDAAGSNEPARFLLNVCFDGGWEPYMRVIWDELGSMLDLMLCHCEGYPLARENSFERYIEWVRAHEIAADFLYLDSGRSSSDHEYLALLEQSQRLHPGGDAALAASRIASPRAGATRPLPAAPRQRYQLAIRGLPALAALYALDRYFLPQAPDGACLLRASRDILFELVELDTAALFPAGDPLRQAHHRMLEWFEHKPVPVTPTPRALTFEPADIQGGMLSAYPDLSGGALLLLRISNRAQAVAWLSAFAATREGASAPADGLYRNIALSLPGLRALGLSDARLARFPQAFREGMEQRAGVLGDVRHNHPRYWRLPERNWPPGAQATGRRVDLNSVHVLVQLRHGKAVTPEARQQAIARLEQDSGLQLLSVQPLRRNSNAQGGTQEHFGFLDGISQPAVGAAPGRDWSDAVPRGELLLGYPTSREACAVPEVPDALLDRGTFLVVRKLRQHVGRLHTLLDAQSQALGLPRERLLAKMMGRQLDGKPLAAPAAGAAGAGHNDFNYAADPQGSMCPFHAHVRRANPRDPHDKMPRILRRGMSYGPAYDPQHPDDEDRGLVFMAYNASLSEQFETLQRWLAGGNSSGGYSGQPDPFMGVATRGEPRIYRFEDAGRAVHLNLGDQPFVELQWGAYFFVPSIAALRNLPALLELPLPAAMPAPPQAPPLDDAAAWQQWLEDSSTRDAAWAWVRAQPGGV